MVKVLGVAGLILCLALPSAFAGGAGNCIQPLRTTSEYIGIGGAFEYNYVKDRMNHLNNKRGPRDMKIEHVSQTYGKGIIGLFDNYNIYGKIGVSGYDLEFVDTPEDDATMVIDLEDGLYTGAGANALFPITEVSNISVGIGCDIQGNFSYNNVTGITRSGQNATSVAGSFYGVDGQNSVYLTLKYDVDTLKTSIVPYVGGYHSWMVVGTHNSLTYDTESTGYVDGDDFQAAYDLLSFGLLVGVDVDVAKFVNLNVEGRFIGETAITTGATIKF